MSPKNILQPSLAQLYCSLWGHIEVKRRYQMFGLTLLMVLASFSEVLSLGAIFPFLAVLTDPSAVYEYGPLQIPIKIFGWSSPEQLLLPFTIIFGVAALIGGAVRLLLIWTSNRFALALGADLGLSIFRRTLYQSYATHIARNSSEIINGVAYKTNDVIFNGIVPALTILSSAIMLVMVLVTLLAINPVISIGAILGFGLIYAFVILFTRGRLMADSQLIANETTNVIKVVQESLGAVRDVLIDGTQATYCSIFHKADAALRLAQARKNFISQSPRYLVESCGMVLVAFLAFRLASEPGGMIGAVPVLGVFALGAQRMLPIFQSAFGSWAVIRSGQASFQDAMQLLNQPYPNDCWGELIPKISFQKNIVLNNISFSYQTNGDVILRNINLNINKGARIGFVGKSGSGKSTLLDIVMGLLEPSDGTVEVDGVAVTCVNRRGWQAHIAHVPQAIYLADASIAANIAFGVPFDQVDMDRIQDAASRAQLDDVIGSFHLGYDTLVGERGVKLSGGQRQRIGLARALYKRADVLIFDEATSALDGETEKEVMSAIDGLSKDMTILIIAHRMTTLKKCDFIVEISNGEISNLISNDGLELGG